MALRFYFDEDSMNRALIRALEARGLEVTNAVDEGLSGETDPTHLAHAAEGERVLYTFNVGDFYRLHSEWMGEGRRHSGIVLVPQQRYSIGEQMRRILRLNHELRPEEMTNRVEFLSSWG